MRPPPARALRVVVADDSALVREAISHLLLTMPRVELVASCTDAESLTAAIGAERPDVVVADVGLSRAPNGDGIRIVDRLLGARQRVGLLEIGHESAPDGVWHGHARLGYARKRELLDRDRFHAALHGVIVRT